MTKPELSVVAPVYNGAGSIGEFMRRTWEALHQLGEPFEILLVDDGSTDDSVEVMRAGLRQCPGTSVIKLAANCGQSNAIAAGLSQARGEYCVVMDSDLQDRPEDIPALYRAIAESDVDMVIASRSQANASLVRNLASIAFYLAANHCTTVRNPRRAGVFRIIRGRCLGQVFAGPMRPGTVLSQLHAAGCTWRTIRLEREPRNDRRSGYSPRKLVMLALARLLVFGRVPPRRLGGAGICVALLLAARRKGFGGRLLAVLLLVVSLLLMDRRLLARFRPRFNIQSVITE